MEKWLECTIFPGQFTGEFAVKGNMFDATEFSLFAPRECLKFIGEPSWEHPVQGFISVIPSLQINDLLLVTLPQPTFKNGQTITVKKDQVRA